MSSDTHLSELTPAEAEAVARGLDGAFASEMPFSGNEAERPPYEDLDVWEPPGPIAAAFFWCDADVIGIRGPVGSGKTTAHLRSRFRRALMMPRSTKDGVRRYKVVIARATYRQLWQTTIPSWFEVMPRKVGQWAGGRGDPVTHSIQFEDAHGRVEFVAEFLAFGESVSEIEANLRGVQTTDLALEEADTVPVDLFIKGSTRIDRYPAKVHFQGGEFCSEPYPPELQSYGQISCSYNAPDETNWTVKVIEGNYNPDDPDDAALQRLMADAGISIRFFRQPGAFEKGAENLQHLGPKYYPRAVASMRAAGNGHDIKRLIDNQIGYIRSGDPVFEDHYSPRIHRSTESLDPLPHRGLRIGLDQGFFGAAAIMQFEPPYQWRILAELWFKHRMFAKDFALALRELLDDRFKGIPIEGVWSDMAGEAESAAARENETWNEQVTRFAELEWIEPQTFGANRWEPRLAALRASMDWVWRGQPGLLISGPDCPLLCRGFEVGFVWGEEIDKAGNRTTKPKKRGSREADVIDAVAYCMLGESLPDGLPPISEKSPMIGHNGGPRLRNPDWDDRPARGPAINDFNPFDLLGGSS